MSESDSSGEIIIKGGSCDIEFADGVFDLERSDGKQKHKHKDVKIKIHRIEITGDEPFDSGEMPAGFKGKITIRYKV